MIGFYNYTVILTYMSLVTALTGMTFAYGGHFPLAIFCLALSGFFDMFDGKVARSKKDRTDDEKLFGIQLDSLCDAVAFGAFPSFLCYSMGARGTLGIIAIGFYCICGVIRLAYFNVTETNNFFSGENHEKIYHGLPITTIALVYPLVFLTGFFLDEKVFYVVLTAMMFIMGTLFIADFQIKKPGGKKLAILVIIVAAVILLSFYTEKYKGIL